MVHIAAQFFKDEVKKKVLKIGNQLAEEKIPIELSQICQWKITENSVEKN